jgi:hypothetical protein
MRATGLDTEFDGISIIDGLPPTDRARYQDTYKLLNLISSIEPAFVGPKYKCNSRNDYFRALRLLTLQARAGKRYFIHFECHGCPDGLGMGSDTVTWVEQASHLSTLNESMAGQLVLDFSACNGIYTSKMSALASPPPFYAVIGPAKRIAMDCASVVSAAFYRAYLKVHSGQLDAAISSANGQLGYPVILGIRAEAFVTLERESYSFRPNADDDRVVHCRPDGTVYLS